jgi:hypothetical protein
MGILLLLFANTAHAAIADQFSCSISGAGAIPLSASASLTIPRQPLNSSPGADYRSALGSGTLSVSGVTNGGDRIQITLGLNVSYLMQIDSNGKVIRAGESVCMAPNWTVGGHGYATSCATAAWPVGSDPLEGYTAMDVQNGVAYFVPTGALNFTQDLPAYGHVVLNCTFDGTLE